MTGLAAYMNNILDDWGTLDWVIIFVIRNPVDMQDQSEQP